MLESTPRHDPPVHATGMIYYSSYGKHDEEVATVEFLYTVQQGRLIREKGSSTVTLDCNSWIFAHEIEPQPEKRGSTSEYEPVTDRVQLTTELNQLTTEQTQPTTEHIQPSTERTQPSTEHTAPTTERNQPDTTKSVQNVQNVYSPTTTPSSDPTRGRPFRIEQYVEQRSVNGTIQCDVHGRVALLETRNELLIVLGTKWPIVPRLSCLRAEWIYSNQIRVSVGCTLRAFQFIANFVHSRVTESASFCIPPLQQLHRCSRAIDQAHIYLHKLEDLCDVLDIRDGRDFELLLQQRTKTSNGTVVMLMGSAGMTQAMVDDVEREVCRVVVGTSVLPKTLPPTKGKLVRSGTVDSDSNSPVHEHWKHHYVFEQPKTGWDDGMGCYTSEWRMVDMAVCNSPPFNVDAGEDELNKATKNCIQLTWKPAETPSGRKWSSDALHNGVEVLGFMTLSLPAVACTGTHTTTSLSVLMDNRPPRPFFQ